MIGGPSVHALRASTGLLGLKSSPGIILSTCSFELVVAVACRPPDVPLFQGGQHLSHRMHEATSGILPRKVGGDAEYDAHCNAYGRAHAHRAEYESRRAHFAANRDFIAAHNSGAAAGFLLGMNHLGDWSDKEWHALKQVWLKRSRTVFNLKFQEYFLHTVAGLPTVGPLIIVALGNNC